jgi:hypothetical protein
LPAPGGPATTHAGAGTSMLSENTVLRRRNDHRAAFVVRLCGEKFPICEPRHPSPIRTGDRGT